jgi:hypothetical protein
MANDWNYSRMTHYVAEHGGPEATLEMIKKYYLNKGFKQGVKSRNPAIAGVALLGTSLGVGLGVGAMWLYCNREQQKKQSEAAGIATEEDIKHAESALVAGIKDSIKEFSGGEEAKSDNIKQGGNDYETCI